MYVTTTDGITAAGRHHDKDSDSLVETFNAEVARADMETRNARAAEMGLRTRYVVGGK